MTAFGEGVISISCWCKSPVAWFRNDKRRCTVFTHLGHEIVVDDKQTEIAGLVSILERSSGWLEAVHEYISQEAVSQEG